ncbi:MAG TPA: helix-turn-helix transcriptional regulator [Polyangiaceae bacterium]|nr:helix-turn-helix transcriptional regulator [Polyangiaceae bacterium]
MKTDAISIVEAAYDCESDVPAWLAGLLENVAPKLDDGFGIGVSMYEPGVAPDRMRTASRHLDKRLYDAFMGMCLEYPDAFHLANSEPASIGTVTKTLGFTQAQARSWAPYVKYMHPFGVRDVTGVLARDPSGHAIVFNSPMSDLRRPTRPERSAWSRITAHISAGARLRRAIEKLSGDNLANCPDAVLSPSGSVVHAEPNAQGSDQREALRFAAKAIDRARSKARSNEDEALDLWQGLVAGRWSLVEQFDSDGRRFLIARRNDPQVTDPRALNLRERQVLAYIAMGQPAKLIAYSLGVSPSSISLTRRTAMRKLGLQTTADVVRLFAEAPRSPTPRET